MGGHDLAGGSGGRAAGSYRASIGCESDLGPSLCSGGPIVDDRTVKICARCKQALSDDFVVCPSDGQPLDREEVALSALPLFEGRYDILRKLGQGGTARVFKAVDTRTSRPVAIKIIEGEAAETPTWRERLLREAALLQSLRHPNVVEVQAGGERANGSPYLVMEYLEGETLGQFMQRTPTLSLAAALAVLTEIASGLAATHAIGVIHRDVKPDNIFLVGPRGKPTRAKIFDFSFARVQGGERFTTQGFILGTPQYMAPEQAVGDPTGQGTDVYALGVVAYRMLTGVLPFQGQEATLLAQHLYERPLAPNTRRSEIPRVVAAIVMSALRKLPRNRYPSMQDLVEDVERATGKRSGVVTADLLAWDDVYEPLTAFSKGFAEKLRAKLPRSG
jgi:eukaryotic-like serine/threonine-protein kinase